MKYMTIIQKGTIIIFQNEFTAQSEEDAQKIHFETLKMCSKEICEDWDSAPLALVDEQGDIVRFLI